jgi:hypothetical protein
LSGVSCASATACTAVGWYVTTAGRELALAERWDGRRWAVEPAPAPAGSQGSGLFGISCTAPRACTAVGQYVSRAGGVLALAERWDGLRWVIQPAPAPAGSQGSEFSAVSCGSAGSCTAVGAYATRTGQVTLAERWDGTSWRIEATPNPAGSLGAGFNAISCGSARACTAVGASGASSTSGRPAVLAEAWNGTSWHIQAVPSPKGAASSVLSAISCTSSAACTAAGGYEPYSGFEVNLAEAWNGTSWAIRPTSSPAHSLGGGLSAVSCVSAGACDAVGSYEVQLPLAIVAGEPVPALTLAEAWNGTRWAIQATPDRNGAATYSEFSDVSCTSARACTATGDYVTGTGLFAPLAERWNGVRWAIQPIPNPAADAESFLNGVSCASARACTAVGFTSSISATGTLAEQWDGTRWRIQPTPQPAHAAGARLSGVSCTSARNCIAVGDYVKGPMPLAEEWNGTRWRILPAPAPAGARQTSLSGVSCPSARTCTAVGYYTSTSGQQRALAESWDGSRWRVQAIASPVGTVLRGVSCTAPRACTAVGSYTQSTGRELPLAQRWNGRSWAIQPIPSASPSGSSLNAVSCAPGACTAVGAYLTANGAIVLLAEAWNGAQWKLEPATNPAPAFDSTLAGISCSAPRACTSVGSYLALTNVTVTLAMTASG